MREEKTNDALVRRWSRIIDVSSDIVGGVAGVVAQSFLVGPVGAAFGAAAGSFLGSSMREVGAELVQRQLGPREEKRIGAVAAIAIAATQEKLDRGERPRDDGFFDPGPDGRSSADEITEGVLIAAQREHEERKIPFLGRLLANIAFDASVDRAQANLLIDTAEELTYSGISILFVAASAEHFELRELDYDDLDLQPPLISLLTEIFYLQYRGLIGIGGAHNPALIRPADLGAYGVGAELFARMEVYRLREHEQDWFPIVQLLR